MKRIFISVLIIASIISCKKEEDTSQPLLESDYSTLSTQDNNEMEQTFDDIYGQVQNGMESQVSLANQRTTKTNLYCWSNAELDISSKTLTLTYDGTTCVDGNTRNGNIIISYTGAYIDSGSVITTTLQDFTFNGKPVTGTQTVTNLGLINNIYTFNVRVENGSITHPGGIVTTWASDRTRKWVKGPHTRFNILDDTYLIHGTASGTID